MTKPFIIGSRGSPLALAQARMVAAALEAAHGWDAGSVEILAVKTSGDRIQDRPLAEVGGKALWTKELDMALLAGETHCSRPFDEGCRERPAGDAAHRGDAAARRRAGPADRGGVDRGTVARRARRHQLAAAGSAAQAAPAGPEVVSIRGNVDTRLAKRAAGEVDATLLAAAGLFRLGRAVGAAVELDEMIPAPAQGAIGIECRADDAASATC